MKLCSGFNESIATHGELKHLSGQNVECVGEYMMSNGKGTCNLCVRLIDFFIITKENASGLCGLCWEM